MLRNNSHVQAAEFKRPLAYPDEDITSRMSRQLRIELLDLALRDAVIRHSVPRAWVKAELIPVESPGGTKWDVRLVIQERDGLLWKHATDFHSTFVRRLRLLDTGWKIWLSDVIWQFPHPGVESNVPARVAMQSTNSSVDVPPELDEIFIGVPLPVDGISKQGASSCVTPQQIQLEKLREAMSSGDGFFMPEEGGTALDFQETRPFASQE